MLLPDLRIDDDVGWTLLGICGNLVKEQHLNKNLRVARRLVIAKQEEVSISLREDTNGGQEQLDQNTAEEKRDN